MVLTTPPATFYFDALLYHLPFRFARLDTTEPPLFAGCEYAPGKRRNRRFGALLRYQAADYCSQARRNTVA
jgi:hypothetical protein